MCQGAWFLDPLISSRRLTVGSTVASMTEVCRFVRATARVGQWSLAIPRYGASLMSATIEPTKSPTKREVQERLRDWRRRLDALFARIEGWVQQTRNRWSVQRGAVRQRHEQMMRDVGVAPRELPTLVIQCDRSNIEFVPSCLWIIGANGRVDISVGGTPYTLVDMGGKGGQPSDWQLVNRDPKIVLEPFTRDAFLRIAGSR